MFKKLLEKGKELVHKTLDSFMDLNSAGHKLLYYLRLNDEEGKLSLTNLALMIILVKIAFAPVTSMTDITALATAVFGYSFKKYLGKKEEK